MSCTTSKVTTTQLSYKIAAITGHPGNSETRPGPREAGVSRSSARRSTRLNWAAGSEADLDREAGEGPGPASAPEWVLGEADLRSRDFLEIALFHRLQQVAKAGKRLLRIAHVPEDIHQ
jgi:hypothetical protein